MALVERLINCTFVLGEGAFGESGTNTVTVSGLRASARIAKAGGAAMSQLSLDIWGMTPSLMRQLSTLGLIARLTRSNVITVEAGDITDGMAVVFIGTIINGYCDYQASPQVSFHVEGGAGVLEALIPQPPTSFVGSVDVATVLTGLAKLANLQFEPNGVQRRVSTSYLTGAARQQISTICDAAGINWIIDNGTLAIWEPNSFRGGLIPLISKTTGMQGYPAFTSNGIMLRSLFNPNVGFGKQIQVKSDRPELVGANGTWIVNGLDYSLDANMPAGEWSMSIQAVPVGFGPAIPNASG